MSEEEATCLIEESLKLVKMVIEAGYDPAWDLSCAEQHLRIGLGNLRHEFD